MAGARRVMAAGLAAAMALALLPGTAGADAQAPGRWLVTVADRGDLDAVQAALAAVGEAERLAPRVVAVSGDRTSVEAVAGRWDASVEANRPVHAAAPPDDPHFGRQWALENTGQQAPELTGQEGAPGLDVGALGAWQRTRGARSVTIAVVDTEVERDHPDLKDNLLPGRSFAPSGTCLDSFGAHGTEVAGITAAVSDNGIGVAGIAPRVRLLPVAFLDGCGNGTLEGAVTAITWAADNGADVLIGSFASSDVTPPADDEVAALRAAIEDAGVPLIAAAGNNARQRNLSAEGATPVYPASFNLRNQLAVAAVDNQGQLADFSNYGRRHVQLGAPGDAIYSTTVDLAGEPGYDYGSGTSYAAPLVAGAVGMVLGLEPVLTPEAVLDLTVSTTRPLDDLQGRVTSGGMLDTGRLVTAVAEGGACPTARVPASGFDDVGDGGVHALAIDCLAWWGVTRGRTPTEYEPRTAVTRGQMATFLATVVAAGPGLPADPPPAFPDVAGSVHERPINALAQLGIVRGFGDGTYRPGSSVTRAQMASFLINTYEHLAGEAPSPSSHWFGDTRGSVHEAAAESLWELGITAGTGTRVYDPHPPVRRDQMASFVARLLDRLVRVEVVRAP